MYDSHHLGKARKNVRRVNIRSYTVKKVIREVILSFWNVLQIITTRACFCCLVKMAHFITFFKYLSHSSFDVAVLTSKQYRIKIVSGVQMFSSNWICVIYLNCSSTFKFKHIQGSLFILNFKMSVIKKTVRDKAISIIIKTLCM